MLLTTQVGLHYITGYQSSEGFAALRSRALEAPRALGLRAAPEKPGSTGMLHRIFDTEVVFSVVTLTSFRFCSLFPCLRRYM